MTVVRRSTSVRLKGHHGNRRLVEYFVVVSSFAQKQTEPIPVQYNEDGKLCELELGRIANALKFEASVTSRYPIKDHDKNPLLHQSIVSFCHPSDDIELKYEHCLPKIHYFVATGGKGTMMYGVCLTVFEPLKVEVTHEKKMKKEEVFQPKCLCILSTYPYLVAFREYLTQLERISKSGNMTAPLERYIANFCSEVPAPPPGSFEVQTTISNSVIKLWSPPFNQPIAWVSLPFPHLFECLDIDNIITLWHALALERQVLIVSTQKSLLTTACEILISLLFPMKWSHAYIPLLPKCLVSILSAPMPFLCGIDKSYLTTAIHHLNEECIVVDLDSNVVSFGPKTPELPPIPRDFYRKLSETLRENAGMVFREARSLTKDHDFSDRGEHLPLDVKMTADAMWESKLSLYDEALHTSFTPDQEGKNQLNGNVAEQKNDDSRQTRWDAVQEAFLTVYVGLLSSYRQCLVFPSKDGRRTVIVSGTTDSYGGAGFRSGQFLKLQRQERRNFVKELINTQMFDEFITKRLYGSGAFDVTFFDRAIDNYLQRGHFSMDRSLHSRDETQVHERPPRPSTAPSKSSMRNLLNRVRSELSIDHHSKPLLCSSVVRRRLKTLVPPEPSNENLPSVPVTMNEKEISASTKEFNESISLDSKRSMQTESTELLSPLSSFESPEKNEMSDVQLTNGSEPSTRKYRYKKIPSKLNEALFGKPRPLPRAISAEFDKQNEDASFFRKKGWKKNNIASKLSPEETTFTVFFIALTAIIGRELQKLSSKRNSMLDRTIVSTTNIRSTDDDSTSDDSSSGGNNLLSAFNNAMDVPDCDISEHSLPRNRFRDPLYVSKLEETRTIAAAQLDLAFEMLDIMKERKVTSSPVAYKCLIDACGRCGDTDRATELLKRMHDDGIVADGVVYSCLVAAFSAENTWRKAAGKTDLPEWANGASVEVDWNKVGKPSYEHNRSNDNDEERSNVFMNVMRKVSSNRSIMKDDANEETSNPYVNEPATPEKYVTDTIANHIGFGENLLEIVYPDISIDTDDERCPQCDTLLLDDMVVSGWTLGDCQDYTTSCHACGTKFVPKFCVQSSSETFRGSKGLGTPLICERLSPWVLEKELRLKMGDWDGIDDLLDKDWREKESKNAVLWWNLILAFMRYRIPFTFLLQGNFEKNSLIVPHTIE